MLPVVISRFYNRILALFSLKFFFKKKSFEKEVRVVTSRSNMNGFFDLLLGRR